MKRRKLTKAERQAIYDKCHGYCAYCGRPLEYKDMQVDHVIPLYNGGRDELDNMLPACRSCNHYKATLSLESFRKMVDRIPNTLYRDNATYRIGLRFGKVTENRWETVFYFETLEGGENDSEKKL